MGVAPVGPVPGRIGWKTAAMSSTIIVGTDGSDLALAAARQGLSLLRPASLVMVVTVVFGLDPALAYDGSGHAGPSMTESEMLHQRERARHEGQDIVERTVAALGDVVEPATVDTLVLEGGAGPALCELAEELSAAAMVVGTRGRGGLKRALLGSVSDHVVRNAACPVLVINGS